MTRTRVFEEIKAAIESATDNERTVEKHFQMLKHADALAGFTGREFCEHLGLGESWGAEFNKMKNLANRLQAAGLDLSLLN